MRREMLARLAKKKSLALWAWHLKQRTVVIIIINRIFICINRNNYFIFICIGFLFELMSLLSLF